MEYDIYFAYYPQELTCLLALSLSLSLSLCFSSSLLCTNCCCWNSRHFVKRCLGLFRIISSVVIRLKGVIAEKPNEPFGCGVHPVRISCTIAWRAPSYDTAVMSNMSERKKIMFAVAGGNARCTWVF